MLAVIFTSLDRGRLNIYFLSENYFSLNLFIYVFFLDSSSSRRESGSSSNSETDRTISESSESKQTKPSNSKKTKKGCRYLETNTLAENSSLMGQSKPRINKERRGSDFIENFRHNKMIENNKKAAEQKKRDGMCLSY